MKDIKFILIIMLMFFGVGIMEEINDYDYNVNNTGIMYQENENIVLNENNRTYDYNINYNLDESYLHYFPIKKSGLLDNLESKNLASPDLENKEYLGDGWYQVYKDATRDYRYNIYNGQWYIDGDYITAGLGMEFFSFDLEVGQEYTISVKYVSGEINRTLRGFNGRPNINIMNSDSATWVEQEGGYFDQTSVTENEQLIFTLQIEKGDTATSYQVPYIPSLKIDFKGSNQVEYINPYKEQIIEIDDINNVNNIEFELLNTKNPVVYNWNITTNPNMSFVRFYNDETKLLYDFTDIQEINRIGNNLFGNRSNAIISFNSALNLVNTFYAGFQKLFDNEVIDTIGDWLGYLRLGINLPLDLIKNLWN